MNHHQLKESWKKDEAMSFKGWDFTYLNHRWEECVWQVKITSFGNIKYKCQYNSIISLEPSPFSNYLCQI